MGYFNGRHRVKFHMKSYAQAKSHLDAIKPGKERKLTIGNNTWLFSSSDGTIYIRHHNTDIVTYHPDGRIELRNGRWTSQQTSSRIQAYTPFRIQNHSKDWYVHTSDGVFAFAEGITFLEDGSPVTLAVKLREADRNWAA